jgi:hypothetical protein
MLAVMLWRYGHYAGHVHTPGLVTAQTHAN